MKFMLTWAIPSDAHEETCKLFLETGGPSPAGIKRLGRWHAPGSLTGFHLIETDDLLAVAAEVAQWARLCEIKVTPVLDDEEGATSLATVYGD